MQFRGLVFVLWGFGLFGLFFCLVHMITRCFVQPTKWSISLEYWITHSTNMAVTCKLSMFCQGQFVGVEMKPFPKLWKWSWVPSLLECLEVLWIPSPLSLLAGYLLMQALFSCLHDSSRAALKESTALFLLLFADILLVSRSVYSLFCK